MYGNSLICPLFTLLCYFSCGLLSTFKFGSCVLWLYPCPLLPALLPSHFLLRQSLTSFKSQTQCEDVFDLMLLLPPIYHHAWLHFNFLSFESGSYVVKAGLEFLIFLLLPLQYWVWFTGPCPSVQLPCPFYALLCVFSNKISRDMLSPKLMLAAWTGAKLALRSQPPGRVSLGLAIFSGK